MAEALQLQSQMFLYRSLTVGLLAACCFLLMRRPMIVPHHHEMPPPSNHVALQVIDVASNAAPDQDAQLVRLGPGEQIATVDDHDVADPVGAVLEVMTSASRKEPGARNFVDLTLRTDSGERRVLLVMH